ncbi:MAG: dihydrofolate reductase [Treponema sp.]|jgi:dihydrofolate reductase|nr:dihydrofolate reductase [Treponema sp.]
MREIIIIAAMSENRVIGKNNVMPWSIREEMAHFTKLTKGWPCIMGRKTWESLKKKPLPGRLNVVISGKLMKERQFHPRMNSSVPEGKAPSSSGNSVSKRQLCSQAITMSPVNGSVPVGEALSPEQLSPNLKIFPSLSTAIEHCAGYEKVFICGGESIYRQALSLADKIELSVIHRQYDGDTYFPEIDNACWKISNTKDFDDFSFITYTRIKQEQL